MSTFINMHLGSNFPSHAKQYRGKMLFFETIQNLNFAFTKLLLIDQLMENSTSACGILWRGHNSPSKPADEAEKNSEICVKNWKMFNDSLPEPKILREPLYRIKNLADYIDVLWTSIISLTP